MFAVVVFHDDEFYTVLPFVTDRKSIDAATWQVMTNFRDDDCQGCDTGKHDGHTIDFRIYNQHGAEVTDAMMPTWAKGK